MAVGVILGLHRSRPKGDFVVLRRVTGLDYPSINIDDEMQAHMKTGGYTHVWFQEITVPKQDDAQ